jgi:hypothetical protein
MYLDFLSRPRSRRKWLPCHSLINHGLGYGLDGRRIVVQFPAGADLSLLALTQPLVNVYRELCPQGIKRPGREADHTPPTSVESENE